MIELSQVVFELPGRTLFDELSFRVNDHDRVALVGPNGSGKTTLLKMMAGMLEPDQGQVARTKGSTLGYLPQDGITHRDRSVLDEARSVFDELLVLKREADELEERMAQGDTDAPALERYGDLLEEFRRGGGWEIEARTAQVLDGLGFDRADWSKDAGALSGGWQMRLALAKLLIRRPDVLLLDEPTNHLDLLAATWLEEFLKDYPGAFVLVSHDRHFLDNIVTHVGELRYARVRLYTGNYTHYLGESEKEITILEERKRRQDEQVEKMERFIGKFRYQATKAKQVQSRIKQLEKVERIELPRPQSEVRFRFPEPPRSGRRVLELTGVHKAYDSQVVFRKLDLIVERGERLALVGPNGAGKSTLMRILAGRETFQGERQVGHNVSLAYFAQDEGASLDASATVLEEVTRAAPLHMVPQLRSLLGSFLFRGDDVFKPVGVLSGGERTRVALARMLLEPHNVLLLDEPTNHLDLASKEVLLESLADYTGTIVIVSHDRYFVDGLATRIADVGHGDVAIYPGGYEDFLTRPTSPGAARPAPVAPGQAPPPPPASARAAAKAEPSAPPRRSPPGKSRGEAPSPAGPAPAAARPAPRPGQGRSEREAARKREALEKKIEDAEQEVQRIEQLMAAPGFFADPAWRAEAERHKRLTAQVQSLYDEWDRLGG